MADFPQQHLPACFTHPWQGCTIRLRPRCRTFLDLRIAYETVTTRFGRVNGSPNCCDFLVGHEWGVPRPGGYVWLLATLDIRSGMEHDIGRPRGWPYCELDLGELILLRAAPSWIRN